MLPIFAMLASQLANPPQDSGLKIPGNIMAGQPSSEDDEFLRRLAASLREKLPPQGSEGSQGFNILQNLGL